MRSYVMVVAFNGSDVPSGSSPVYHSRSVGLFLMLFTSSVTAVVFWYVLWRERGVKFLDNTAKRRKSLPAHVVHQVDADFLHTLDHLRQRGQVAERRDGVDLHNAAQ